MKRAPRFLVALLLCACLTGVGLAFSVFRPREVVFPATVENKRIGDTPWRTRIEVKHRWKVSPRKWAYGKEGFNRLGVHFQTIDKGWQYGPFAFEEERKSYSWPFAVERAARILAARKLGVKEPILDIRPYEFEDRKAWYVVASGPSGKRVEMSFLTDGKPCLPDNPR